MRTRVLVVLFVLFLGIRTQVDSIRITSKSDEEGPRLLTMDATNIPWGYFPDHDAFRVMTDEQLDHHYRVLDDTNQPNKHDDHNLIMATFQNSSLFHELTPANIDQFLWKKKPLFIVLLCNCERDQDWGIPMFEKKVGGYQDQFVFLYALPEAINSFSLVTTFQINKLPTVIIDNVPMGSNNEKFRILEDISSWSWRNAEYASTQWVNFMQGFLDESLSLVVRSEDPHPLPLDEPGKVWDLVGDNFKYHVMDDDTHDFLMLVYSPNCGACKALMPLFHDLAYSLTDFPQIRVATFDKTNNDFPVRGLFLKHYPTVYFFPAKHKYQSINFFDFHQFHFTEEGLLNFVKRHADNKIDFVRALDVIKNKPELEYDGSCVFLTPETHDDFINDPDTMKFVDYFAPWCVYCRLLLPIWEELCAFYKDDPDVQVAKFDAAKYEKKSVEVGIRSYPTLNLYPQGRSSHPLRFRGNRELEVFKNFIESNRPPSLRNQRYGENGHAVSKEQPCMMINGNRRIDLSRLTREDDDHNVPSDDSKYEFFVQICAPTKRHCANKAGKFGVIQIGVDDPKKHCYNLGSVDFISAQVAQMGERPVTEIVYLGGEKSDDFRTRVTRITAECDPSAMEDIVVYEGESDDRANAITYNFRVTSAKACNV